MDEKIKNKLRIEIEKRNLRLQIIETLIDDLSAEAGAHFAAIKELSKIIGYEEYTVELPKNTIFAKRI